MRHVLTASCLVVVLALGVAPLSAQTPTSIVMEQIIPSSDLARPMMIHAAPGDGTHLYVIEQNQADIHVITFDQATDSYSVNTTPVLDLTGLVDTSGNEQGLLGIAFHPDFQSNGWFYVHYNASNPNNDSVVYRYTMTSPTSANPNSATLILGPIDQPQTNHNGGMIAFGPDGKLYVALGDGGNGNDTGSGHVSGGNGQSGANLLGKILRINDDGSIPSDNPFVGTGSFMNEIFHYGLRNPWRFSFDSETGDMWIGDVGQDSREEIDYAAAGSAGLNFGWRCMEGDNCTGLSGCTCNAASLTDPVHDYGNHSTNCTVVGGYVYRGHDIPDLDGTYFFAEYCADNIWTMSSPTSGIQDRTNELESGGVVSNSIVSFGQDIDGEIFVVQQNGRISKIVPADPIIGLGAAKMGSNGKPILWGVGDLTAGSPGELNLVKGPSNALALLFVSLGEGHVPFKGGILKAFPIVSTINLGTNAAGRIFLPFAWPAGVPGGTDIVMQYGFDDPGASSGVGLSNGLKLTAQ